ncbi:hypothetical protein L208DRAFT_1339696, partial [Tricholoma matsutake]
MSSIFCLRGHPKFLDHGTKCFGVVLHVLSPSGIMSTFLFMSNLSHPKGPFDDCINFQKQSKDLMVFSPTAGQYVTIAWCAFVESKRITPTGIKAWLCNRGLHWSCFCALVSGSLHLTQIVQSAGDGKVYVFCSEYPSKCHFYLNLSEIYITATLESHYSHLFTLATGPYFQGYCGEHVSEYPLIQQ